MRSMIAMLTQTVADLSGRSDESVARLRTIERQIEEISDLDESRVVRVHLERCLHALREAAVQQRDASNSAVERLQDQIGTAQRHATLLAHRDIPEADDDDWDGFGSRTRSLNSYVAIFKLHRADHIASRFGEATKEEMAYRIGRHLKGVLQPSDRLLRWKDTAFVMLINSSESARQVRGRLSEAVDALGRQHLEMCHRSAMLAIGVDWAMLPAERCTSLDSVFAQADVFLRSEESGGPR